MKLEIHIDTAKLYAMHLLAAQHDIRTYLNGVRIEARDDETRMLATNGIVAGWLRNAGVADVQNVCGGLVEFTIPNDVIARARPVKGQVPAATVLIDRSPNRIEDSPKFIDTFTLRLWDGTLIPFAEPEGTFPQLSRVRPTGAASGVGCNFNGEWMNVFAKINKLLTNAKFPHGLVTTFDGTKPIRVQFQNYLEFFAIAMPYKAEVKAPADLGWDWPEPVEAAEVEMMAGAS